MATKKGVLGENSNLTLKIKKGFDPAQFYKNRADLYVWSDFKDRILEKAGKVPVDVEYALHTNDLLKYADDEAIEKELPEKHLFNESEVCAIVADLIEKQPKAEEGPLLANGYANLFYTPAFVVLVRWYPNDRAWRVFAWPRDDFEWYEGRRVFSPATNS